MALTMQIIVRDDLIANLLTLRIFARRGKFRKFRVNWDQLQRGINDKRFSDVLADIKTNTLL